MKCNFCGCKVHGGEENHRNFFECLEAMKLERINMEARIEVMQKALEESNVRLDEQDRMAGTSRSM